MPKPVLQAMVLADHVYQDRATGKFVIAGTFGSMLIDERKLTPADPNPAESEIPDDRRKVAGVVQHAGSPYLYFALTEVHGTVPLRVRYVNLSDATVLMDARVTVKSPDPVSVVEFCIPLPPLPIMIGNYSLDLLHDEEILGSWRVTVKSVQDSREKS